MKNVDFNEIKKILLERKLPDYDDFFEVLNEVTETLENEDESYRPKNDDEKCGSLIDFQSEDRLTLVVPDLHARPDFLLNILSADVRKIINENEIDKAQMMSSFIEGIQKVNSCLNKIFTKNGVIEYKPKSNEKFDPLHHDAVYKYEDLKGKNGTIGKVLFSGFKIGNRILRPAKVGVIKNNKI